MDLAATLNAALADRYVLRREIGRGGMATVFKAEDLRHQRAVAIKVLRPELTASITAERFIREIRITAQLDHPHVLGLIDSGEADGLLYYVMPYVKGESLRERLRQIGPLPVDEAVSLVLEVADGLACAHRNGVIHRDIKPGNILLADGHARVVDFGIARALELSGDLELTRTGLSLGTAAYMSPEQGFGEEASECSDIYSLACVLYEAIAGEPPFSASTHQALLAQHAFEPVRPLSSIRPEISPTLEATIARALAKSPSDRFRNVAEFAVALTDAAAPAVGSDFVGGRAPTFSRRPFLNSPGLRKVATIGVFLTLMVLGSFALSPIRSLFRSLSSPESVLDSSVFLVLPFAASGVDASAGIDGYEARRFMLESLSRWRDLKDADPVRVREILDEWREREHDISQRSATATAARLGAGRLVRGVISNRGDTIEVQATLYDVTAGGARISTATGRYGDSSDASEVFQALIDSLLIGELDPHAAEAGPRATRSFSALAAYGRARVALDSFDILSATDQLEQALSYDSLFTAAAFWKAQLMAWVADTSPTLLTLAARADSRPDSASPPANRNATALHALAERRFTDACGLYRDRVAADSLDYLAWIGLGACQSWDHAVVADGSSPSGWRFRQSPHSAVEAYRRALNIEPELHRLFRHIDYQHWIDPLIIEPHRLRPGHPEDSDSIAFLAYPAIIADTLAFVPHSLTEVVTGAPATVPSSHQAALNRNLDVLRELVVQWTRYDDFSPHAHESLALLLERRGDLAEATATGLSAIASIRRARQLATDSVHQLRAAIGEVRLNIKLSRYAAAKILADTLLRVWARPSDEEAENLASLAALTGHVHLTAHLLARGAPGDHRTPDQKVAGLATAPRSVARMSRRLLAYASFGVPVDSIRTLKDRVERLIETWVEPGQRLAARQRLLDRAMELAFPTLGLTDLHRPDAGGRYLLSLQWALLSGDTATVETGLARLAEKRTLLRTAWVTPENVLHESRLALAIGDTLAATRRLGQLLEGLPALRSDFMDEPARVAGLIYCMALRAELARAAGASETAIRWASAGLALWGDADAELEPLLRHLEVSMGGRESDAGQTRLQRED